MNLMDMRTVILSYIISNGICAVVIGSLWFQSRRRFAGLGLWLADFVMQFMALLLVALRGTVPDFVSATVSNAMIIGGTILLYVGLGQFIGKPGKQIHNVTLLVVFVFAHAYFLLVLPRLDVRTIILSLGLLVICAQCAWLLLYSVDEEMRPITRIPGIVFLAYCMVSVVRIFGDLILPPGNDFFRSNSFDTLLVMTYQMLFVILALGLFLMVNRRLLADLEHDIAERKRVEEELRLSEEKFFKAFQSSPDAILLTRLSDGKLVEVNEGFSRLSEYSREEALAASSIDLGIWANPQDRQACVAALRENQRIHDHEYDFRAKSGRILNGLYSGEIVYIGTEAHILSIVRDITEQKRVDETLRRREREFHTLVENSPDAITRFDREGRYLYVNPARARFFGLPVKEIQGKTWWDLLDPEEREEGKIADASFRKILEDPREHTVEYQTKTPDGLRWVQSRGVPEFAKDGSVESVLVITRDITERRQAEEIIQLRLRLNEFAGTHSLDELMQKALDEIGLITGSPIGFYHFVESDQKTLSLQAWSTRTLEEFCHAEGRGLHYSIDQAGVWVDCVHQRRPVIHNDYAALPHRKGMPEGHAEVIRELVVPTMRGGQVVSILGVGNKPSDYDEKDIEVVSYIADVIWVIVERKRAAEEIQLLQTELREQAIRDPLTGLYNRRYLNETLDRELARAKRGEYPVSLVMIDIDQFKSLNDTFGHHMGDSILRSFAAQLISQTRVGDTVCRYGGEEFLVVLPDVTIEIAHEIAERWRKSFQETHRFYEGENIGATVSCGISEFPANGDLNVELIAAADKGMYQAKAAGRNRVAIWRNDSRD